MRKTENVKRKVVKLRFSVADNFPIVAAKFFSRFHEFLGKKRNFSRICPQPGKRVCFAFMAIIYLGIGWLAGIWLAANFDWPVSTWFALAVLALLGCLFTRNRTSLRLSLLCLAAVGFGGMRYATAVPVINSAHIAYYNDTEQIALTGLVIDEPDVRDRFVNLRVRVEEMTLPETANQQVSGEILVRAFRFPVIAYGMRLKLEGRLETPPEFEGFSYKEYLARQGMHSLMNLPQVTVLSEGEGSRFYHAVFAFKSRAQAVINQLIPDPQAALLSGILLGNDNGISPDLAEAFRVTGMTHVIAISGFNIALLAGLLVAVGEKFFSRRGAVLIAIPGVAIYTVLVGADASVVRAAIMGALYLIASRWLGRPNYAFASLFLAAIVMTLFNPHTLWDVGFQLSFAATLGLMLYADPLIQWTQTRLTRWLDRPVVEQIMGFLSEAIIITIAAQILTLPLMMLYFNQLSLISLLANALILPAQPGVMIWGGLATLTGMVSPLIAQLFAWVAWLFLAYSIWLVRLFAAVPWAAVTVHVPATAVLLLYALVALITWYLKQAPPYRLEIRARLQKNLSQRVALGFSVLAALLTISWGVSQPDGLLHLVFMDVGQGDATLIVTPNGRQILIDGGYYPSVLNDQLGQHIPFWDREIDMLIATHPDADHVSGLVGVFDRYRVNYLVTDGEGLGESPIYDAVLLAAEREGTAVHQARVGQIFYLDDGVRLEVLHPGGTLNEENRNENSVSVRLVYHNFTFLLTGDAEEQAEQQMLATGMPLAAIGFKAGHHGSRSSSTTPFLEAVRPQIIVISSGVENRFGHPHPELLARAQAIGAAVLRTDELGAIEVITDGQTMWWQQVRKNGQ